MQTLRQVQNKLKEVEAELKELKQIDIELSYLNENIRYGNKKGWVSFFGDYVNYGDNNSKYNYVIENEFQNVWVLKIKNILWKTITKIIAEKKEVSFNNFVDMVKPVIKKFESGERLWLIDKKN